MGFKHLAAFALLITLTGASASSRAQENKQASEVGAQQTYQPAQSPVGEEFKSYAGARWQRTKAQYLSKDADPGARISASSNPKTGKPIRLSRDSQRLIAFAVLALLVVSLVWWWWHNRLGGGLFARRASEDKFREEVLQSMVAGGDGDELSGGDLSADRLKSLADRRAGLRLLLLAALRRAAGDNDIVLKRSLTTRDVLARTPVRWPYRDVFERIVAIAEPVLFGGRDVAAADYLDLVDQSADLLPQPGRGRQ